MAEPLALKLLDLLGSIKGRDVFHTYCGVSTGSVLDIHFAPMTPRTKALGNTSLSQLHGENMGTLSLFVECSWRLQVGNRIIVASGDVISEADAVFPAINRLDGMCVTEVILPALNEVLDLTLCFQDGLQFNLFCDSGISGGDDYSVFHEDEALCVASGCEIRLEKESNG